MPAPEKHLCVTGPLGGSAAGLAMLSAGLEPPSYLKEKHLAPGCRLDISPVIAPLARAMIDISDGLAAEVSHLCDKAAPVPKSVWRTSPSTRSVRDAARRTGNDPLDFALAGGEDSNCSFQFLRKTSDCLPTRGFKW